MQKKIAIYHNLPSGGGLKTIEEFSKRLSSKYILDLYSIDSKELANNKYFRRKYLYKFRRTAFIKSGPLMRLEEDYNLFTRLSDLHKKIAMDINKRKYDLVILSHDRFIQTPFLSQYLKCKTIYYCQEPWRYYYEYNLNSLNRRKCSIKKILLTLSDYRRKLADCNNARSIKNILVNSVSSMEAVYRAYGVYASICHLGVDTTVFRPLKIKKENYIFSVGNLSIHKGHEFVIDSLSLLKIKHKPELYISSGGINLERKEYLEKYASDRRVKLRIFSRVTDLDMVRLYNMAKIVICAAHLETLGLSAIEAMACGTPVVAIKEGGYRDMIIDGANGLFAERSEKSLADKIKLLLSNHSLYSAMAKQSRQSIYPYWTWDAAAKRLENYISILLK